MAGQPFPKASQLARGERRYRRKVASPKQWQAIIEAKRGPCRVCSTFEGMGIFREGLEYHHLVARSAGGDDVQDNIVPLHPTCHERVTRGNAEARYLLGDGLTEAERAYVVGKLGESGMERLFGVGRT